MRGFDLLTRARERGTDFGEMAGGGVVAAVDSVCCRETDFAL